ncbi:tetratricopeptide repeat protein [Candidatus Kuenenia stuttgartiensis]|uniref:Uncharacterized protein n=1 Tax=Kuenenia stuttgartiensis TaxID=174633 RepID=A0A2C9CB43_KUEST|nr:tetratricopeptide repeat protein [Candidatus Kuenenia stuttgartiensis]SOH02798.1 hypothetical protein KSMBR1_0282 [Candidatus Kuenenia stuttgartiensis]
MAETPSKLDFIKVYDWLVCNIDKEGLMRENERIDMAATEAYKPLPGDLKRVGEWRHVRKEGAIATWARILRLSYFALAIAIFIGNAYAGSGENMAEIDTCKQAVIAKPDDPEAHFKLGNAYAKSGMYTEAIEAYKQAIRIEPDYADAHCKLGAVYAKSGMYTEAIEAFKQAIRIKPDYVGAHLGLGISYDESGMHQEAIAAYKQAIRIEPDFAGAHNNLGAAYAESGMYREAIEAFIQAIRIKPDDVGAHFGLGAACLILNERGSALEQYKILKDLDAEAANKLFDLIYK